MYNITHIWELRFSYFSESQAWGSNGFLLAHWILSESRYNSYLRIMNHWNGSRAWNVATLSLLLFLLTLYSICCAQKGVQFRWCCCAITIQILYTVLLQICWTCRNEHRTACGGRAVLEDELIDSIWATCKMLSRIVVRFLFTTRMSSLEQLSLRKGLLLAQIDSLKAFREGLGVRTHICTASNSAALVVPMVCTHLMAVKGHSTFHQTSLHPIQLIWNIILK